MSNTEVTVPPPFFHCLSKGSAVKMTHIQLLCSIYPERPQKAIGKENHESHSKTEPPAAIIHSENSFLVKILLFQPQYALHTSEHTFNSKVSKTYPWLKGQVLVKEN